MSKTKSWLNVFIARESAIFNKFQISIVDIGSSASPPQNCIEIASISKYIGFDPDLREPQESTNFGFTKYTIIDKAISCSTQNNVKFYLTKYPQCSSTLCPNIDEYKHYSVADFFSVVDQVHVPATSLNSVLEKLGTTYIDWLKLDTQGTDYNILRSLNLDTYNKILVVELEPGVTSFYKDENRFSDIHEFMLGNGFWLSDLNQQRFPRISNITIQNLNLTVKDVDMLGNNPFAFELQYFRTIEYLENRGVELRDFFAFWVLAMTNSHYSFAIEIAMSSDRLGIDSSIGRELASITLNYCQNEVKKQRVSNIKKIFTMLTPPILSKIFYKLTPS
jgi:FkbM family methyltransferase